MKFYNLIRDYKKNGFVIVDNLLPEEVANKLEIMYSDDYVEDYSYSCHPSWERSLKEDKK